MLDEICGYLHNWFCQEEDILEGSYTVSEGSIALPLANGQYFPIVGSVFNDGVYQYPAAEAGLVDETFDGQIWPMAIPRQLLNLIPVIEEWQEKNGEPSALASESFGGYTYSKATSASGGQFTWQDAFKPRLRQWRKL